MPIKDFVLKGVQITKQNNFISANTAVTDIREGIDLRLSIQISLIEEL